VEVVTQGFKLDRLDSEAALSWIAAETMFKSNALCGADQLDGAEQHEKQRKVAGKTFHVGKSPLLFGWHEHFFIIVDRGHPRVKSGP